MLAKLFVELEAAEALFLIAGAVLLGQIAWWVVRTLARAASESQRGRSGRRE
jgi:hypothetical protein